MSDNNTPANETGKTAETTPSKGKRLAVTAAGAAVKIGSGGGFGLSGVVGTIAAWATTPSFVGLAGFGKSLLVGAATSVGFSLAAIPAAIGGAVVGVVAGVALRSRNMIVAGAFGGAMLGVLGGGVAGAVQGFKISKDWLDADAAPALNVEAATSFNAAATAKKLARVVDIPALTAPAPKAG